MLDPDDFPPLPDSIPEADLFLAHGVFDDPVDRMAESDLYAALRGVVVDKSDEIVDTSS